MSENIKIKKERINDLITLFKKGLFEEVLFKASEGFVHPKLNLDYL